MKLICVYMNTYIKELLQCVYHKYSNPIFKIEFNNIDCVNIWNQDIKKMYF